MKNQLGVFKKKYFSNWQVLLFLAVIIFIAGYFRIKDIGLYGDDWGASTYLYYSNLSEAVKDWWQNGSGEISNFRMLAVILPVIWFYVYKIFGLIGISLLNFVVYLALADLLFLLLKEKISFSGAVFGAILFALYPTNNAYLWQVTMSYSIALLFVFIASYFFSKQKWFFSLIFLTVSILVNEGVFFIYFINLLPNKTEDFSWLILKDRVKKWVIIVFGIIVVYSGFRVYFELSGTTGGNRAVSVLHNFNILTYLIQFVKSFAVVLIIAFAAALWKIYYAFKIWHLAVGATVAIGAYYLLTVFKDSIISVKNFRPQLVMLMGLMLIIAGRYYGFYYVPSINVLNLDSRYYFAASVGGTIFFVGLYEYLVQKFNYQYLIIILSCAVFGVLGIFRFEVQKDYADSFFEARIFWKELVTKTQWLPENGLVVVNIPDKTLGKPVGLFEAVGDLRVTARRMYNKKVGLVTSPFIQNLKIGEQSVCIDSAPFYKNECFDKDKVYIFEWNNNHLNQVAGIALKAESRELMQIIPDNFKEGILK